MHMIPNQSCPLAASKLPSEQPIQQAGTVSARGDRPRNQVKAAHWHKKLLADPNNL
jgi:hypothetical protein